MTNPKDGSVFVWVPGGKFRYGPRKKLRRLDGFWIARQCVTLGQFENFLRKTGYIMESDPARGSKRTSNLNFDWSLKSDDVIRGVTYGDAVAYANWSGAVLPSAEMWEKAARGTDGRIYPWGNTIPTDVSWDGTEHSKAISKLPSPYGCIQMLGEGQQWTSTAEYVKKSDAGLRYFFRKESILIFQIAKGAGATCSFGGGM